MARSVQQAGGRELGAARSLSRKSLISAFLFSAFANLLMLTAPLYMLQVYDRVIPARSEPTLLALSLLAAFLFLIMGLLDYARSRTLARVGARIQDALDHRVLDAAFRRLALVPGDTNAQAAQRDLEVIGRFWGSPVTGALLDLPWVPIFIAALFIFHTVLGWFAVAGGLVLILITLANRHRTETVTNDATVAGLASDRQVENLKSESELIRALGMSSQSFARWYALRRKTLALTLQAGDASGGFSVTTRTFRLFLQSAILGLGAWLVLRGTLSPGAMIAGSILMGRALQPVEVAIGQWQVLTRATSAHRRISALLNTVPPEAPRLPLPRPQGLIQVQGLTVVPPGGNGATLRNVSFQVSPGQAMGVIGLSGSGKSTLARALVGVWPPAAGAIRLDGATLEQYDADTLGSYIGYLPQRVSLFDGTIAENIARLDPAADPQKIVEAAKSAAVHDLIVHLPDGYSTRVFANGGQLSGGQIQRIGLARAFYGSPQVIVLDEPNSNLDSDGSRALNHAIAQAKARGCAVFIMAHRPAAIQECDLLMVMKDGMIQSLGPRDQILRETVRNASDIARPIVSGTTGGGLS